DAPKADVPNIDLPDFSGLIGADEADSWKAERAKSRALDQKEAEAPQLDLDVPADAFDAFALAYEAKNDVIKATLTPLLEGEAAERASESLTEDDTLELMLGNLIEEDLTEERPVEKTFSESESVRLMTEVLTEEPLVEETFIESESINLMTEALAEEPPVEEAFIESESVNLMTEVLAEEPPVEEAFIESESVRLMTEVLTEEPLVEEAFIESEPVPLMTKALAEEKEVEEELVEAVSASLEPLPSHDVGRVSYRPDMTQIEMKATAQRKSSGRFLRVDAERLGSLSNQVIELSTDQSRGHVFESGFLELATELRGLQRDWRYFSKSFADFDDAKRERIMLSLERGFESQIRKHRRLSEELSVSQQRGELMYKDL
ncbi:MAG: hypothetical protein Q9M20_00375, partial [Mariprofundaceae bacterium]|nr:hypothetical protein [Mariprofundaceae bacterium]